MASQKEIVNYYFKRKADSDLLFECRCGKVRKQDKLRGHGNLMDHITRDHKNYLEEVRNNAGLSLQLLSPILQRSKIFSGRLQKCNFAQKSRKSAFSAYQQKLLVACYCSKDDEFC